MVLQALSVMNATASPKSVRRNACERCFGQKLRCTREHGSKNCIRCVRLGAECIERPKRSMGRPRELSRVCQSAINVSPTDANSPRIKSARHSSSSSDIDMTYSEFAGDDFMFAGFDANQMEFGSMELGLDADLGDCWQSIFKSSKDCLSQYPVDLVPRGISPLSSAAASTSDNINNNTYPLGAHAGQPPPLVRTNTSSTEHQQSSTNAQAQARMVSARANTLPLDHHQSSPPTTAALPSSGKNTKIRTIQRLSQLQASLLSLLGHAETSSIETEFADGTLPFELLLSFRHSSGQDNRSDEQSKLTSQTASERSSLATHLQGLFAASQTFMMLVKKIQNATLNSLLGTEQGGNQTNIPVLRQVDPAARLIVLTCYTLLITMYEPFAQILQDQHMAFDNVPHRVADGTTSMSKSGIQLDVKTVMLVQLTTYLVSGIDTATREYLWLLSRDSDGTNKSIETPITDGRPRRMSHGVESQDPGEAMCASMKELTIRRDDLRSKLRYCESVHIKSIDQLSM